MTQLAAHMALIDNNPKEGGIDDDIVEIIDNWC